MVGRGSRGPVGGWIRIAVAVGAASPVALLLACRAPTEISLNVTTDVKCADFSGAAIVVGHIDDVETKPPVTTTTTCSADGTIGSLVVVPSGSDDDEVVVRIAGGVDRDPSTCSDPSGDAGAASALGCIVARRAVRYIHYTPLTIDIPLRSACNGIVCSNDQTCVDGACVSDVVPSGCGESSGCGEQQLTAADGGAVVVGAAPSDAGVGMDATLMNTTDAAADDGDAAPDATLVATDAAFPVDATATGDAGASSCAGTSLQSGALWPTSGGCPNHQGRSAHVGNTNGNTDCIGFADSAVALAPLAIAADGTLYVGGSDGNLYARTPDLNGVWTLFLQAGGGVTGVSIAADGSLYVTASGNLFHVSSAGALLNMHVAPASDVTAVPLASGDVAAAAKAAFAIYNSDFSAQTGLFANGTSQIAGLSYAPALGGNAESIRTTWTLGPMFERSLDAGAVAQTPGTFGGVTVIGDDGVTYGWTSSAVVEYPGIASYKLVSIVGMAVATDGLVVTSTGQDSNGTTTVVTKLALGSLSLIWQVGLSGTGGTRAAPAIDGNGVIFVGNADRTVTPLASSNGQAGATLTVQGIASPVLANATQPIIGNGALYVGTGGGFICRFE